MNPGRFVLSQILDLVHRQALDRLARRYDAESRVRHFGRVPGRDLSRIDAVAECLEKRRDGILAFNRLEAPWTLNVTFLSTNNIENVMRNTQGTIGRMCRWVWRFCGRRRASE